MDWAVQSYRTILPKKIPSKLKFAKGKGCSVGARKEAVERGAKTGLEMQGMIWMKVRGKTTRILRTCAMLDNTIMGLADCGIYGAFSFLKGSRI